MCECVGFLQEQDTVGESYLQMLKAMLHAQTSLASQARLRRPCRGRTIVGGTGYISEECVSNILGSASASPPLG